MSTEPRGHFDATDADGNTYRIDVNDEYSVGGGLLGGSRLPDKPHRRLFHYPGAKTIDWIEPGVLTIHFNHDPVDVRSDHPLASTDRADPVTPPPSA